jgi:hypothetical protein
MDKQVMRHNFRRPIPLVGAIFGALAIAMAAPARAGMVIQLSTNGSSWTDVESVASGTAVSYSNPSYNGFDITNLGLDSNSPGTSPLTFLEGSVIHIKNTTSGTRTLYIRLGDTGFTSPLNPSAILLDSQIGVTVTVPGAHNALTYQSYVDPADGQNSQAGFTTGPQMPNITGHPKSSNDDTSTPITSGLTSTYSITEYFKITLDGKSQINFSSGTDLSAVPEPSSLVLSCVSVLGLVGYTLQRRISIAGRRRATRLTDVRK